MKMSNADIVLNAAERVVKCKFAYICPGYYITAPAFSSRAGGWGGWGFYCFILQNVAFLPGCRAQMVRSRTVPSFDVDKQLFVGFVFFSLFRARPPPRVLESLGAAAQQHLLYHS